jgi:hypothetical protein
MTAAWRFARIVCLIVATALSTGAAGSASWAGTDHGHSRLLQQDLAEHHDCCEPEPTQADECCSLACPLVSCATILPSPAAAPKPIDRHRIDRWRTAAILKDGISPETSSPPPRG